MMNSSNTLPQQSNNLNITSKKVPLKVNGHDRWFFVGKTGMGKSHLIKHLARLYAKKGGRIVIIDGPDQGWLGKDEHGKRIETATSGQGTIDKPRLVTSFNRRLAVQLFRPKVPGYSDAKLLQFLQDVFKEEYSLVIFDEMFGILDTNHQPEIVMQLWSQGRKHDIAVWAASQRPSRIPEIVMSQAEHWVVFRVINTNDRKKIADWTGSEQIVDVMLPPRFWWYQGPDMTQAVLMRPIGNK